MEENDPLINKLISLKPETLLDVGCGCGSFTAAISPICGKITAVDMFQGLIDRSRREHDKPDITYLTMDGKNLLFPDCGFTVVMERGTLHHILEWEKALDEIIRVSSKFILLVEPFDDPRSEEKRNTLYCHNFLTEVQNDAGYPHYTHIKPEVLIQYLKRKDISMESHIVRTDKLIEFDEFFCDFSHFIKKSTRKEYFSKRFEELKKEFAGKMLCDNDMIYIFTEKYYERET
jgi:ubiquinone/menaquinone biosynthesis C-methylase UbiE